MNFDSHARKCAHVLKTIDKLTEIHHLWWNNIL